LHWHRDGLAARSRAATSRAVRLQRHGTTLPPTLRALAHRDYRLWAVANLISTVGSWMQLVAQN
jgi:hypothetical protein